METIPLIVTSHRNNRLCIKKGIHVWQKNRVAPAANHTATAVTAPDVPAVTASRAVTARTATAADSGATASMGGYRGKGGFHKDGERRDFHKGGFRKMVIVVVSVAMTVVMVTVRSVVMGERGGFRS